MADPNDRRLGFFERLSEYGTDVDRDAVRAAVNEMNDAVGACDFPAIRRLSLAEVVHLDRNGQAHSQSVWTANLRRRPELRRSGRITVEEVSIMFNVALIVGRSLAEVTTPEVSGRSTPPAFGSDIVLQIWVRVKGIWLRSMVARLAALRNESPFGSFVWPEL